MRRGFWNAPYRQWQRLAASLRDRVDRPSLVIFDSDQNDVAAGTDHGRDRTCHGNFSGCTIRGSRERFAKGGPGIVWMLSWNAGELGDVQGLARKAARRVRRRGSV